MLYSSPRRVMCRTLHGIASFPTTLAGMRVRRRCCAEPSRGGLVRGSSLGWVEQQGYMEAWISREKVRASMLVMLWNGSGYRAPVSGVNLSFPSREV
jgi:hypothetical protein